MNNYSDFFTREELLASISHAQFIPGQIGALGLFDTIGLTGTTLAIESTPDNDVAVAAAVPRGSPPAPLSLEKRAVHTFSVSTYSKQMAILADEVLNVRAAGTSGAAEVITTRRDEAVAKLRRWADLQLEHLRVTCINSADNAFGNSPADQVVAFGTSDAAMRATIFEKIIQPMESALGGIPYTNIIGLCDDTYWKALISSKSVSETYLNWLAAAELRNQPAESGFLYGGVMWMRYRGTGTTVIESGKCKIVPQGVPGLLVQAFAPDDTLSSVGQGAMGQPYYLRAFDLDDDKGWRLSIQTHPVMVCTRPEAILTVDLS